MREYFLLVLLAILWGGSFTLNAVALETLPPATIVFGRLSIGAALLLTLALWSGDALPRRAARWGALAVQGVLQSALPFCLISWGQQHIDSGLAGLLSATPPIFAFLLGYLVLADRDAGARQALGILLGMAGVLVVMAPAVSAGRAGSLLGQLAVLGASLSYAAAAYFARRFADERPTVVAACSMTVAAALMAPISLLADDPAALSPSVQGLAAVIALGALSTALAMAIYFRLVRSLGPIGVTSGGYLRAGFSVLFGALALGERIDAALLAGLALIVAGVAVTTGGARP